MSERRAAAAERRIMAEDPKVVILTLAHNHKEDTLACLRSLYSLEYGPKEILCVDNASSDGTAEAVEGEYPETTVVRLAENKGFTGGCNEGTRKAEELGYDYLLLLNNDTVADRAMLREMVDSCERDSGIGILGALIFYFRPREKVWFAGGTLHWWRGFARHETRVPGDIVETDYACGCCLLIRRACLEDIGPMDENLFLYCEDVDWCLRARKKGWRVTLNPRARMWHKIGVSSGGEEDPLYVYYWTRSWLYLVRKHLSGLEKIAKLFSFLLVNRARFAVGLLRKGRWVSLRALWWAVSDSLAGRMGKRVERVSGAAEVRRVEG